jgi:protein-disulfide isomerase
MKPLLYPIASDDHIFGSPAASIELLEYGDYECTYCGLAYLTVKVIQRQLGSDVKYVFRNFPMSSVHPHAFFAAVAAEAAGLHGKYWEMHDIIFENQGPLDREAIFHFAAILNLDIRRFKDDVQRKNLMAKVDRDFESGLRSGVKGTPSFFINGEKYEGDWMSTDLLQHLKNVLAEAISYESGIIF